MCHRRKDGAVSFGSPMQQDKDISEGASTSGRTCLVLGTVDCKHPHTQTGDNLPFDTAVKYCAFRRETNTWARRLKNHSAEDRPL